MIDPGVHKQLFTKKISLLLMFMVIISVISIITADDPLSPDLSSGVLLSEGWQYRHGDSPMNENGTPTWATEAPDSAGWEPFDYFSGPPIEKGSHIMWVRTTLPTIEKDNLHLYFRTLDSFFEMYIDGKLVYRYGEILQKKWARFGSPWQIVPLPEDSGGKSVAFRMYSVYTANLGSIKRARIDSAHSLISQLVKKELGTAILACLYIFAGMCIILVFSKTKVSRLPFLSLGFFSISVGVWLIAESEISLLLHPSSVLWSYIGFFSGFLLPVGFCLFVQHFFADRLKPALKVIWKLHLLFLFVSFSLDLLQIIPMHLMLTPFMIFMAATIVISFISVVESAIAGKPYARLFLCGMLVLVATAVSEILGWHFKVLPWTYHSSKWGMFCFLLVNVYILSKHYLESQSMLESYAKDLEYKKMLLEAADQYNKMKTEFFTNMSHEFRTPLNILLTSLHLNNIYIKNHIITFQNEEDKKRVSDNMKTMQQNCYRLMKLVNNLIDMTRIESGYLEPNFTPYDIVKLVKEVVNSVSDFIKNTGLTLSFHSAIQEKFLSIDVDKMERILLNLLSNAVKFSKTEGHIFVSIHEEKNTLQISVKDTGIGIPEDKLELIFERFMQAGKPLKSNHEGSGIGLSLVRSLVQMHGGKISVKSTINQGSEFIISLPIKAIPQDHMQNECAKPVLHTHMEKLNIEFSDI